MSSASLATGAVRLPRAARPPAPRHLGRLANALAEAESALAARTGRLAVPLRRLRLRRVARIALRRARRFEALSPEQARGGARAVAVRALGAGSRAARVELFARLLAIGRRLDGGAAFDRDATAAALAMLDGGFAVLPGRRRRQAALALAAAAAALSGGAVHIPSRQASRARPLERELLDALGLSHGWLDRETGHTERREAYRCSVLRTEPRQVTLDHLRDRQRRPRRAAATDWVSAALADASAHRHRTLLPPLDVALFDDADALLTDLASHSVKLHGEPGLIDESEAARAAIAFARRLRAGADFDVSADGPPRLTPDGIRRADRLAPQFGPLWYAPQRRVHGLEAALACLHALQPGRDYVASDDGIVLKDPSLAARFAGPGMAGLRALLAVKEGADLPPPVIDEMSLRRFFTHYPRRGAIAASDVGLQAEIWRGFGLRCIRFGRLRARGRTASRTHIVDREEEKWHLIRRRIEACAGAGMRLLLVAATTRPETLRARLAADDGALPPIDGIVAIADAATIADWLSGPGAAERPHGGCLMLVEALPTRRHEAVFDELLAEAGRRPLVERFLAWDEPPLSEAAAVTVRGRPPTPLFRRRARHARRILVRLQRRTERLQARLRRAYAQREDHILGAVSFAHGVNRGAVE